VAVWRLYVGTCALYSEKWRTRGDNLTRELYHLSAPGSNGKYPLFEETYVLRCTGRPFLYSPNLAATLLLVLSLFTEMRCTYRRVVAGFLCPRASCVSFMLPVSSATIRAKV
jgi:hypothetical protein